MSIEMSDIYSKSLSQSQQTPMLTSPSSSSTKSKGRGKFVKNYSVIEESETSREYDSLRRQQSVELGRRKKIIVPNRSFSLNSRFSSSTGHLCPDSGMSLKGRRASGDPTFNQARCVNWSRDDVIISNNNNCTSSNIHHGDQIAESNSSKRNSFVGIGGGENESPTASQTDITIQSRQQQQQQQQRQMSIVLNMPSRQASVRSYESGKSTSSCSRANSTTRTKSIYSNGNDSGSGVGVGSARPSKCGVDMMMMRRESRNNSIIPFGMSMKDLPEKERRHRKVAFAVILFSSFLLISAILCIIVSLHRSRHIDEKQRRLNLQYALDKHQHQHQHQHPQHQPPPVRKENEHLLKVIHQPASSLNVTNNNNYNDLNNGSGSSTTATLLQSDTNNVSHNNNNNNYLINNHNHHSSVHSTLSNNYDTSSSSNINSNNGQSLPRTTEQAEEAAQDLQLSLYHKNKNHSVNINTKIESGQDKEQDKTESNLQQHSSSISGSNNYRKINKSNVHDEFTISASSKSP